MHPHPKIAIIGAGPAGLTLARLLHLQGRSVAVFDSEAGPFARPQGGTLDLHVDGGQAALIAAGLEREFHEIARYDDQGTRLYDPSGHLLFDAASAPDADRPEVDRTALRRVVLAALPDGIVRWDHRLDTVRAEADGTHMLVFDRGTVGPFDLVVGADGTWSRVRPAVSSYRPQYSGLTFIEFGIDDVDRLHPEIASYVGHGKAEAAGDGRSLLAQRNGHGHIRCYAMFRVPPDWADATFDLRDPAKARHGLLKQFAGWAPASRRLIEAASDWFVPRPIYALPVGHHWPHKPGVTLIGDAAHVMSPFGGEGANAAMRDALELSRGLAGDDWRAGVAAYETEMVARIAPRAERAAMGAAVKLSHVGPDLALERMRARHGISGEQPVRS